jgi:uncharacterized protein (TIGR02646 family)
VIQIDKPAQGPACLAEGVAQVNTMVAERAIDPAAGASKKRAFTFYKRIYGPAHLKAELRRIQHHKCCYCEGHFAGQAWGDVEHFRPKGAWQQETGDPLHYPGYFWLAYTWSNLFYACQLCNTTGKKNLFPLEDPAQRLTGPDDIVHHEVPQIIDPGGDIDPRDHIRFQGEMVYHVSDLGKSTIKALKLDRGDLNTARLRHLKCLDAWRTLEAIDPAVLNEEERDKRDKAIVELQKAVLPESPYSSVAIDFLRPQPAAQAA